MMKTKQEIQMFIENYLQNKKKIDYEARRTFLSAVGPGRAKNAHAQQYRAIGNHLQKKFGDYTLIILNGAKDLDNS